MDSMQSQNNYKSNFRTNKLTYTSMILGVLVAFLGIAGWTYNLESLKILLPNQITVKANSAIGMLICGISIAILSCRFSSKLLKHTLSSVITLYILIILLTLLEYILQLNFGIDQFLFTDVENTLNPGRMSPTTAFCFLNIAVALLFGVQTVIFYLRRPIVVALSMSVLFIAGMNFLSHIPNNLLGTTRYFFGFFSIYKSLESKRSRNY